MATRPPCAFAAPTHQPLRKTFAPPQASQRKLALPHAVPQEDVWRSNLRECPSIARSSPVLRQLDDLLKQHHIGKKKRPDDVPDELLCQVKRPEHHAVMIAFVILANAVLTGIDVDICVRGLDIPTWVMIVVAVLRIGFAIAFLVELGLNIKAEGLRVISPCNPMGCFDAAVVASCVLELCLSLAGMQTGAAKAVGVLRLLRLLTLGRLLEVLLAVKEVRQISLVLFTSIVCMCWAAVAMLIVSFLGALFCMIVLSGSDVPPGVEEYFRSVAMGLFVHFRVITLENWPDITDAAVTTSGSALWVVYFMLFIMLMSFGLRKLVISIICEKLISGHRWEGDAGSDQLAAYKQELDMFRRRLVKVFTDSDLSRYGTVDSEGCSQLLELPAMQQLLAQQGVSQDLQSHDLFDILDPAGKGQLTFNEFSEALMQLRWSQEHLHSLMVQHDLAMNSMRQELCIGSLQHEMEETIPKMLAGTGTNLMSALGQFDEKAHELSSQIHGWERQAAVARYGADTVVEGCEDPLVAAVLVNRFESVIEELDVHCSCAEQLSTSATKKARVPQGLSQASQTDATIDFIDELAPFPHMALLQL